MVETVLWGLKRCPTGEASEAQMCSSSCVGDGRGRGRGAGLGIQGSSACAALGRGHVLDGGVGRRRAS